MKCCVCNPKICLFTSLSRVAVELEFWKIDVHAAQINSGDGQKKKIKIVINKCFMHLLHATCLWTALVHSIFIYSLLSVYSLSSKRKFWKWNFEWEEFQFFSQELQILLASSKKIFILSREKKDNHLHQEREGVAGFVGKNGTSLFRLHPTILPRKNSKIFIFEI